jgi:kynureninase
MRHFEDNRDFAARLDREDPVSRFRQEFNFPLDRNGRRPVYLCGNSLGLQPRMAVDYVEEVLANWKDLAVDGHFHSGRPWISYHRYKILIEKGAFPSDNYAAASQLRVHGFDPETDLLEWAPPAGEHLLRTDDLAAMLDREGKSVALLLLPGVQYYTGQVLDMAAICSLGREHGCRVGLDLAHAVGNVDLSLHDWAPDFASWCTYKYLNAGPGAIAGAFIHERHESPDDFLHGWWGNEQETRFLMEAPFRPAKGAEAWQMSNPPILSLAPVVASLELFREVGLDALREKSRRLTGYLRWLLEERFAGRISILTPADAAGCQLSLVVEDGSRSPRRVFDRLVELNVTGDWRHPDVIRIAPAPLYNSFSDVFEFVERLELAFVE